MTTNDGKKPTLIGSTGFSKRNVKMEVDPQAVQDMQRGYEERINRQRDAINRLLAALNQRSEDVLYHLRRADQMAADGVSESDIEAARWVMSDNPDLDDLVDMLPESYRNRAEFDTPRLMVAGYIRHLEARIQQLQSDWADKAKTTLQELAAVNADDTPPWDDPDLKKPKKAAEAFVQPATVGASGVWTNEPDRSDSESLGWAGAEQLMPKNEQRPGSF